jgi:GT2 family glycosyltransferase
MDQRVGIIAPIVSNASPDEAVNLRFTSKYILAKNLINSGMLIPVYTFESIGYFDERLFLGGIDTEFVLRAKNNGFSVYRVNDILIHQNFGESIRGNSILIRTFTILSRIFSIVMLALGKTNQYRYYLVYYNKKQLQINQQDRNKLTEKDKLISLKNRFYDIIGVVIQIFIGDESNVKS